MNTAGAGRADADRLAPVTYLPGVTPSPVSQNPTLDDGSTRDEERARAERVSMHALTRRGVSVSELRATLRSRELDEGVVEHEITRLERVGLLDDAALAEALVRTLRERKRLGGSAINAELQRRGIDRETIAAALEAQHEEHDEELARALDLAERRARQLRSLDADTAKRRLTGFLMRRGYSGGVVNVAVDRALGHARGRGGGAGPVFR